MLSKILHLSGNLASSGVVSKVMGSREGMEYDEPVASIKVSGGPPRWGWQWKLILRGSQHSLRAELQTTSAQGEANCMALGRLRSYRLPQDALGLAVKLQAPFTFGWADMAGWKGWEESLLRSFFVGEGRTPTARLGLLHLEREQLEAIHASGLLYDSEPVGRWLDVVAEAGQAPMVAFRRLAHPLSSESFEAAAEALSMRDSQADQEVA